MGNAGYDPLVMEPWYTNPVVILGGVALLASLGTAILKFGEWKGKIDSDRKMFSDFMEEIRKDIKEILTRLPPVEAAGTSPITLTEFGRSIAEEVGAREVAERLAPDVREQVRGMEPYQVQEHCLEFMTSKHAPAPELDSLINKVAYERGVKREQVLRVIAIELRDQLLE